jgi:nitroimidazol reductase NimA-like FMN-containing flavoprotein (pyridoxamine 5'-phosphate oxidase superfamily)
MLALPPEVLQVLDEFRTCEFSTIGKDGVPVTWPLATFRRPDGDFIATTSIGLPQKAWNIRRNPRVAMLFSDATGSGLHDPPTVLVQGDASCPDEIVTDAAELEEYAARIYRRQPISRHYGADPLSRRLLAWYYYRLIIEIVPRTVRWWPAGSPEEAVRVEVEP